MKKKVIFLFIAILFGFVFLIFFKNKVISKKNTEKLHIPILMYHDITEDPTLTSKICITKERFERDLNFLERDGYNVISFKDLINWKKGNQNLPKKPVIITFDDGKLGVYKYAYPLLKEKNMKMTFFVIGKRLEQRKEDRKYGEYINWNQAKEMYDSGLIEIQPHTYDMHYYKESMTRSEGVLALKGETKEDHYNRFKDDTVKIKNIIKQKTGSDSYVYSFPYGKKSFTNDKVIKDLGFDSSVVTNTHFANISESLFDLKRINVPSHIELKELLDRVKNIKE